MFFFQVAESLGLFHLSVGVDKARHIVVARTKHELPTESSRGTREENSHPPHSENDTVDSNLMVDLNELVDGIETENIMENLSEDETENIMMENLSEDDKENVEDDSLKPIVRTKPESEEKSELEVTKEKVMHDGKTGNAGKGESSPSDAGHFRCKLCGKSLPPGNLFLHEIHCEKTREEQNQRKSSGARKKHRNKDERRKPGLEDTQEEDFDRLVEMAMRWD